MDKNIAGKVALITGGADGLGYHISRNLLALGLKGLVLVDINGVKGKETEQEFKAEFGNGSCIFHKTNVADETQMEDAFRIAIETFSQLDIVINNAGIICENDWKKCVDINLGGCIIGTKLAIDTYLPKYKSASEGVIINISSVVGVDIMDHVPVYTTTKQGIIGLGRSFGTEAHYSKTGVRVLTICPGGMETKMSSNNNSKQYNEEYTARIDIDQLKEQYPIQNPKFVAESLTTIIKRGENGSVWIVEDDKPPYEIVYPNRFTMRK